MMTALPAGLILTTQRAALPSSDLAGEDDVLDIEDADFVIVQLVGCVEGHQIVADSDRVSETVDDPACHQAPILAC